MVIQTCFWFYLFSSQFLFQDWQWSAFRSRKAPFGIVTLQWSIALRASSRSALAVDLNSCWSCVDGLPLVISSRVVNNSDVLLLMVDCDASSDETRGLGMYFTPTSGVFWMTSALSSSGWSRGSHSLMRLSSIISVWASLILCSLSVNYSTIAFQPPVDWRYRNVWDKFVTVIGYLKKYVHVWMTFRMWA